MSQWDGCPIELFDMYMEVGEIRSISGDDCVCIEVWIGSCFAQVAVRPECARIRRRSIWGILKQILILADGKKICLIFQCDEQDSWGNDTENWSGAIWLLLKALRGSEQPVCAILFTRKTGDEIRLRSGSCRFHRDKDRADYIALYENLDILVTAQANRYADPANRAVFCRSEERRSRFAWVLDRQFSA